MNLEAQDFGQALVIAVREPRIDASVAILFKDRLRELAGDRPERVILDLGEVQFLDSSGLGSVVAAMKQLGPARRLELAALTPTVAKVFRLTRMDTVLRIHADVASALGGLAHAS